VIRQIASAYPHRKLHFVCDNYGPHNHPDVRAWLARHPRITLHVTPASGPRLNLVEVFFSIFTPQAIRRSSLTIGQGPHRRHRGLHRRVERPLPPLHLDQDSRRDTHEMPSSKGTSFTRH
jgi:hypothetical protein